MKISVLVDNKFNKPFVGEHGLSLFVESDNFKFLFDSGESDLFIKNAKSLNIDLNSIDFIALSHGDYDHANGLKYLKTLNTPLYAHPDILSHRISKRRGVYAGINQTESQLKEKFNLNLTKQPKKIVDDVWFLGEINKAQNLPIGGLPMTDINGNEYLHLDDSGVAIKTKKGLVVIAGCAHSGICNIIEHAKKITNENKVYAVIGGFHLKVVDEKSKKVIDYLKAQNIDKLFLAHCTSDEVCACFEKIFPHSIRIETGKQYTL